MRGHKVWLAALLALSAAGVAGARDVILVDYSGSMKGFAETGALTRVVRLIREHSDAAVRYVISQPGQPTELVAERPQRYGAETRLYEPLEEAVLASGAPFHGAAYVWFLTDNQPGSPEEQGDLDRLYDWLRQKDGVPWAVSLYVLRLPFDGPLYGRDGRTRIEPRYQGPRGVVLYVARLAGPPEDEEARSQAARNFQSYTENVLSALAGAFGEGSVFLLPVKPLAYGMATMRLVDEKTGSGPCAQALHELRPQASSGQLQVQPDGSLLLRTVEGKPYRAEFFVELGSTERRILFKNIHPQFAIEKGSIRSSDFDTDRFSAKIVDAPPISLGGEAVERRSACVRGALMVEAPPLGGPRLRAAWKAFRRGDKPAKVEGTLQVKLVVDKSHIVIEPRDLHAYSTGDEIWEKTGGQVQGKVYRLQELFDKLKVEDGTVILPDNVAAGPSSKPGEFPLHIEVTYSPKWALVLLLPMMLLGAVVVGAVLLVGYLGQRRYRVELGGEDLGVLRGFGRKALRAEGSAVGQLQGWGVGCRLRLRSPWCAAGRRLAWLGWYGGSALLRAGEDDALQLVVRPEGSARAAKRKTTMDDPMELL